MARDVQDAQVPQSPWMGKSGPDRNDQEQPKGCFDPSGFAANAAPSPIAVAIGRT